MANTISITITSGLNSDGFSLEVTDDSGKLIERSHFSYGYNVSWIQDVATEKAPYVKDLISSYREKYQAETVEVKPGENVFLGGQVSEDTVRRFKRFYLN